jgi:hypothetical protein
MFAGIQQESRKGALMKVNRIKAAVQLLAVVLMIGSTQLQAQPLNLRLDLSLTRLSSSVDQEKVVCTLSHDEGDASGDGYVFPDDGAFVGFVNVPVTVNHPLLEYQEVQCRILLCEGEGVEALCETPVSWSQQQNRIQPFYAFDDAHSHRLQTEQPIADSLVLLHTPPPSHQKANKSAQNNPSNQQSGSGKSSKGGMSFSGAVSAGRHGFRRWRQRRHPGL